MILNGRIDIGVMSTFGKTRSNETWIAIEGIDIGDMCCRKTANPLNIPVFPMNYLGPHSLISFGSRKVDIACGIIVSLNGNSCSVFHEISTYLCIVGLAGTFTRKACDIRKYDYVNPMFQVHFR